MKTTAKLLSIGTLLMLAACGTVRHDAEFAPGFEPEQAVSVKVGDVVDAAPKDERGERTDFDIAAELREQLEEEHERSGLGWGNGWTYVLNATIKEYEPGSAGKRWLLPG